MPLYMYPTAPDFEECTPKMRTRQMIMRKERSSRSTILDMVSILVSLSYKV